MVGFGFLSDDGTCAAQHGEVGRVSVSPAGGEGLHGCDGGVLAENPTYGIEEDPLPVCAGAIEKKQGVLANRASQAIADDATHERDMFVVAIKDPPPGRHTSEGSRRRARQP